MSSFLMISKQTSTRTAPQQVGQVHHRNKRLKWRDSPLTFDPSSDGHGPGDGPRSDLPGQATPPLSEQNEIIEVGWAI